MHFGYCWMFTHHPAISFPTKLTVYRYRMMSRCRCLILPFQLRNRTQWDTILMPQNPMTHTTQLLQPPRLPNPPKTAVDLPSDILLVLLGYCERRWEDISYSTISADRMEKRESVLGYPQYPSIGLDHHLGTSEPPRYK